MAATLMRAPRSANVGNLRARHKGRGFTATSFEIQLPLECRVLKHGSGEVLRRMPGESRTLATKRLTFTAGGESLHQNCGIEVALDWPAVLQDGAKLRLILRGKIISKTASVY